MMLMISAPQLAAAGTTCKQGDRGVGVEAPEFRDHSHSTSRTAPRRMRRAREERGAWGALRDKTADCCFVCCWHFSPPPHPTSNNSLYPPTPPPTPNLRTPPSPPSFFRSHPSAHPAAPLIPPLVRLQSLPPRLRCLPHFMA